MIKILGINYFTEKEASQRYGYSPSWFENRRYTKRPPNYIKVGRRIFYNIEETDKWFKKYLIKTDYS